ncbi:ABC transporter substrate-binding protein [Microbacterium elymi]|uniref:ABC transporter substrate-binding protein n=1 Tax=Microbacterium elymi TaxID=2909587 RepID=A0ABY5NMW0_9MICO|nr:ABC transporter substrate-binding protein [Microbacterium elymi]UUT36451.1 ABC transporter substrate-binding protein [Microbacterium elymi]
MGFAAVAAVCVALVSGCTAGGSSGGTPTDGDAGTLNLYSFTEPTSWDPAAFGESPYLPYALAVYDSLFILDKDGKVAPKLATGYKYSDDNLTLTLTLQTGVKFSDGTPFNADAVKANMKHFQGFATPAGPLLQNVASIDAVDDSTVKLTLSQPDPGLLFSLTQAAGLMGNPKDLGTKAIAADPDGTGPYTLDTAHSVPGSKYTFQRKDGYWDQKYPYSTVTYAVFPEETARLNAFKSGQIQYAHTTTASAALDAKNAVAGADMKQNMVTWEGLFFLDRDGKMLPQAEGRAGARGADHLDRRGCHDQDHPRRVRQGDRPDLRTHDGRVRQESGRRLAVRPRPRQGSLAEAGYPDGFTVPWPRTGSILPEIYTAISQYWSKIGVKTKDVQWAPGEAVKSIMAGDYGLVYFSNLELLDTWSVIQLSVAPHTQYNPFHSETPELDKLISTLAARDRRRASRGRTGGEQVPRGALLVRPAVSARDVLPHSAWHRPDGLPGLRAAAHLGIRSGEVRPPK